jgi:ABC-type multidrug transport system, ATPase component
MRKSLPIDINFPIVMEGASKRFGSIRALAGLDLRVQRGSVHGFLGPNGAGKSTTIRALLGQIRLDGGEATVLGADPWRDAPLIHEHIAYVPGDTVLWPGLTGGECIDLMGRLQGSQDRKRREQLIERFELDPRRRVGGYSKGNRQKVALIAALATRASLLLLDEPTSGLDPVMERRFVETIREVAAEGRTILLSSHIMSEVELLCEEVTIIRAGRAIVTDSLANLRGQARVRIGAQLDRPVPDTSLPTGGIRTPSDDPLRVDFSVPSDEVIPAVSALIATSPRTLTVEPANLDELFWQHYEGSIR